MMTVNEKQLTEADAINLDRCYAESDRMIGISRRQQALLAAAGQDGPAARWYVLMLKRGFDIPVDKSLEDARIERWMASQKVDIRRRSRNGGPKPEPKTVPFLPGYLFVHVVPTPHCWAGLLGLKGVAGVIGGAECPTPVTHDRLLKLRAFVERDPEAIEILTNALKAGDEVRIDSGPFASYLGLVASVSTNARAIVEVMIFGRAVSVDLELAQLTKSA